MPEVESTHPRAGPVPTPRQAFDYYGQGGGPAQVRLDFSVTSIHDAPSLAFQETELGG
jgi:hypothetical protein